MSSAQPKNEGWLYGLAFLIAVAFRLIQLGTAPLTDSEATLALQALQLARGREVLLAPQPAYILFTSIFFAIIESTNFMARLVPALAGSALVFVPVLFKNKIGARPALILAFLFAFDPGLVALSRQSSGTILAVTFLLSAWGMWMNRREIAAGIFFALALLSGPSVWSGLLILLLTSIFLRGMNPRPAANLQPQIESQQNERGSQLENLPSSTDGRKSLIVNRSILLALLSTFLLAGTLFFTVPNGLSAAFASLPSYFNGWVTSTSTTASRTLFALVAYEALGIVIGVLSLYRGFRTSSKRIIRLSMWLGVALLLAVFYRQIPELAWAILPLLALAAMELSRALDMYREEFVEVGVAAFAISVLSAYIWYNIAGIALNPFPTPATVPVFGVVENPRFFVLYGLVGILLVSIGAAAFGWSTRLARLGATWAFAVLFGLYSVGAAWGASGLRNPGGVELWLTGSRPLHANLLRTSVDEVSEFSLGHVDAQPVTIYRISSPALEWLLRNHALTVVSTLDPQVAPPIVITPLMSDLGLPSAYRGQDFTWRQTPSWSSAQDYDWIIWLVFRKLPLENETLLLWARNDLFPDARESQP